MGDLITITGVRATGYHGVFEHERREGQVFIADAVLSVDAARAAVSDELHDSVDYGVAAQRMHDVLSGPACNLIETVASRIADALLALDGVISVEVTVHKPQAPIQVQFGDVSVTVRRP